MVPLLPYSTLKQQLVEEHLMVEEKHIRWSRLMLALLIPYHLACIIIICYFCDVLNDSWRYVILFLPEIEF